MKPLRLLLIDTETNGLPKNKYAPPWEPGCWPAILQLSWAHYSLDGQTLTTLERRDIGIALDPAILWDAGAAAIHGVSEAEARHGVPALTALLELGKVLRTTDVIVAHNLAFDKSIIRAAAYAEAERQPEHGALLRGLWPSSLNEFCTMRASKDLVKIPATAKQAEHPELGAYKAPRLNELYTWLNGHVYDLSGATLHSSKADTHCLAQCLQGLIRKKLVSRHLDTLRLTTG
jgi:DNA polymerase III epsilon subunit-like protein